MKKAFALLKKAVIVIGGIVLVLVGSMLVMVILLFSALWPFLDDISNEPKYPYRYRSWNESIENIFDEMWANECKSLRNVSYIKRTRDDDSLNVVSLEFKNPSGARISQNVWVDDGSLGSRYPVNLDFFKKEKNTSYSNDFSYFSSLNILVSYYDITSENKEETGWENIEKSEEQYYYLLNDIILNQWLETDKSSFAKDDLGEFKLLDTIPYAYTGLSDSKPMEEILAKEFGIEVLYSVWLNNDRLLCVQKGGRFQTRIKESNEACGLEELLILNNDFYHWLKTSGQATGNLERIPESREKGMENTQLMLQNCPVEEMEKMLPACEFYLEPGYLHIRFPYWNWESENEGWERNGDELWRGWLNLKTEDIEGFLKVEKW